MMQLNIHQQINIQQLRVGSVSNSSVLQIGSAGSIQSLSQLYNAGGYTGPAPELVPTAPSQAGAEAPQLSLVPFPNPT